MPPTPTPATDPFPQLASRGASHNSQLIDSLIAATRSAPAVRKLLVGPDINYCRETLVTLARRTGGWIGWEPATLRTLATELAFLRLLRQERRSGTDIEIHALVESALDAVIADAKGRHSFSALQKGLGFRRAVIDAVLELRIAGVSPAELSAVATIGDYACELADILAVYEHLLNESGLCDSAGIFAAAIEELDRTPPDKRPLDHALFFIPGSSRRGLRGQLIDRLVARGACVLRLDRVVDAPAPSGVLIAPNDGARTSEKKTPLLSFIAAAEMPDATRVDQTASTVDLFCAASPTIELREALRRAAAEGLRWDKVEIATTDPDAYAVALDALCQRLDIRATMLLGVPLSRTRIGRALDRWLDWLERDYPASLVREALEVGDLLVPKSAPPAVLARELRRQHIGWGRARYEQAIPALERQADEPDVARREEESDEDFAKRRESRRAIASGLESLIRSLIDCVARISDDDAGLASATLAWSDLLSAHDEAERQVLDRLRTRLAELAKVPASAASFPGALAAFRESLADLRAWPMLTSSHKPWAASGGMIHLTDVRHAGITGRPRIFIVGLDAQRATSAGRQDPLLTDGVRQRIGGGQLPTLDERRAERAWTLSNTLAALRGHVTLSYAVGDGGDRPRSSPAPALLQAFRLVCGDPSLSYDDLRKSLNPPASAVPSRADGSGASSVDARDVWLDTIAKGDLLLDGEPLVRACFEGLGTGLAALEAAQSPTANAHHGIVPSAGAFYDPLGTSGREMSPSELEKLASCPMAWFYTYGLRLRPPNDEEYDPNSWLDALERGSLLHDVFERFVSTYRGRQADILGDAAHDEMLRLVDEAIQEYRAAVPVPGETVFALEANELRAAGLAFLRMERAQALDGDSAEWLEVEFAFGRNRPATFTLGPESALRVRGRADRVDRLADGSLRVIDYKTGSTWAYKKSSKIGPFRGGRQLQPSVYAGVVQSLFGARVSAFEYRFPTVKGSGHITSYTADALRAGTGIVADYLGLIGAGQFIPTNDSSDCKYCDARSICRVSTDDDGWVDASPPAAWAEKHGDQSRGVPDHAQAQGRTVTLSDNVARKRIEEDLGANLLVEASAGSGKTTALVKRMLALIATGVPVENIAAVTFTRRAADELRERFQNRLEAEFRTASNAKTDVSLYEAALRDLPRAFTGTIHAFCARLLRERPIEIGLDPRFFEVTEAEWEEYKESFWNGWLEHISVGDDETLAGLHAVGIEPRSLVGAFLKYAEYADVRFESMETLAPDIGDCRRELEALLDRAWRLMPKHEPADGWDSLMEAAWKLRDNRRATDWSRRIDFCRALTLIPKSKCKVTQQRWGDAKPTKAAAKELSRAFEDWVTAHAEPVLRQWREHRYPIVMRFLESAAKAFQRERHSAGRLGFTDLRILSARLLRENPAARDESGSPLLASPHRRVPGHRPDPGRSVFVALVGVEPGKRLARGRPAVRRAVRGRRPQTEHLSFPPR